MMRLFLSDRYKGTLFDSPERRPNQTRQQYLNRWFGNEIQFTHRTLRYVFSPFQSEEGSDLLIGVIAREHIVQIGKPPEENYKKEDVPDWGTANVFMNATSDADGQKIAMQANASVGKPLAVMKSLVDRINADPEAFEWFIALNVISSEDGFWEAATKFRDSITEIDLKFAAPNIWGGESETEKALKELHNQNGVDTTEVKLKSSGHPINPGSKQDDGRLANSVDFIRRGGGSSKIKSRGRTVYNSENNVTQVSPQEDFAVQDTEKVVVSALARWLLNNS